MPTFEHVMAQLETAVRLGERHIGAPYTIVRTGHGPECNSQYGIGYGAVVEIAGQCAGCNTEAPVDAFSSYAEWRAAPKVSCGHEHHAIYAYNIAAREWHCWAD